MTARGVKGLLDLWAKWPRGSFVSLASLTTSGLEREMGFEVEGEELSDRK
jgi:hypothetical protein